MKKNSLPSLYRRVHTLTPELNCVMGDPVRRPIPPNRVPRTYAQDGNTPLHAVCYRGDYQAALMLLLRGVNVDARNIWRETPLHQVRMSVWMGGILSF